MPRLTRAQGDSGRGSQPVCVINAAPCFRHKVSISLLNASPSESDRGCARTLLTPHIFMRNWVPLLNKRCVWASVAVYHLSFEPSIPALPAACLHVSKYGKTCKRPRWRQHYYCYQSVCIRMNAAVPHIIAGGSHCLARDMQSLQMLRKQCLQWLIVAQNHKLLSRARVKGTGKLAGS